MIQLFYLPVILAIYLFFDSKYKKPFLHTHLNIGTLCPRCGVRLAVRTAAKGERKGRQFSGCSDFPKCRYTQNMPKNQP